MGARDVEDEAAGAAARGAFGRALIVHRRWPVPNTTLHVGGLAALFLAAGILASAIVEAIDGGGDTWVLGLTAAGTGLAGWALRRVTRVPAHVSAGSAFAAVAWTWIIASVLGAVPYLTTGTFGALDVALFESISGFTTTGATVLVPIEGNGAGILFWRQLTQWYGGMGMVVLAVAVLPFLGVGGLELIKAEAPGPTSDRLSPRVSETAKRLWIVYGSLTGATAVALALAGLSPYDAVAHAFTTLSTGGFSPYDASIAHFDSVAVEVVLIVAMFLAGVNFTLHYRASRGEPRAYTSTPELRAFAGLVVGSIGFVTVVNLVDGAAFGGALRDSAFSVVAIATTTGYATADFALWLPAAQLVLLFAMVVGGTTGSTAGGAKILRFQVLFQYAIRELRRARHPRGVFALKMRRRVVPEAIVGRIAGFLIIYMLAALVGFVAVSALGTDLTTSLSGVISSLSNIGPGLGDAGPASNFLAFTRPARGVLMFLMLFGRLEVFPMLLMFVASAQALARGRAARGAARAGRSREAG